MIAISESEMNFGDFDETNIFHIEKSRIYKELGTGIKTVEFILKYKNHYICISLPWLADFRTYRKSGAGYCRRMDCRTWNLVLGPGPGKKE